MTKLSIIFICFTSKFGIEVLIFHQTYQKKEEKGVENIMVENGMHTNQEFFNPERVSFRCSLTTVYGC